MVPMLKYDVPSCSHWKFESMVPMGRGGSLLPMRWCCMGDETTSSLAALQKKTWLDSNWRSLVVPYISKTCLCLMICFAIDGVPSNIWYEHDGCSKSILGWCQKDFAMKSWWSPWNSSGFFPKESSQQGPKQIRWQIIVPRFLGNDVFFGGDSEVVEAQFLEMMFRSSHFRKPLLSNEIEIWLSVCCMQPEWVAASQFARKS